MFAVIYIILWFDNFLKTAQINCIIFFVHYVCVCVCVHVHVCVHVGTKINYSRIYSRLVAKAI